MSEQNTFLAPQHSEVPSMVFILLQSVFQFFNIALSGFFFSVMLNILDTVSLLCYGGENKNYYCVLSPEGWQQKKLSYSKIWNTQ